MNIDLLHSNNAQKLQVYYSLLIYLLVFFVQWGVLPDAYSQTASPELRILVQEENNAVHIYHTALPAIGHGFNIYRKSLTDDEFEQLNTDPIRGVTSGTELRAYLGTLYDDIEQSTSQSTANGTFTKLRSDIRTANLLSFVHPKVAEALGRLYIDPSATIGEPAIYKVEFVDALDKPTGVTIEQTTILLPQKPVAPIHLRAESQDGRITVYWQYPVIKEDIDDKVIQFLVYRIDPATDEHEQVNTKVILKNNAIFEYAYTFAVPDEGQTEQLYVRAVDISGQQSDRSEVFRFEAIDTSPPDGIIELQTRTLPNKRIEIKWEASGKDDIQGYNLYRSASLNDKASYIRLNKEVLSPVETTYNDTLDTNNARSVYYYRVTALDDKGNEGPFSAASLALLEDATAPSPPTNLEVQFARDNTVHLTWDNPDESEDFKSFIVLRYHEHPRAPRIPSRVNSTDLNDMAFVDKGIAGIGFNEGDTYKYEVVSVDSAGNASQPATAKIDIPDQTAPSSPGGTQVFVDNASRISIFWNPSASEDVMSYIVYRRAAGTAQLKAMPVSRDQLRLHDTSVRKGVSYEYWVTAADFSGNESLPTEKVSIQMRDFTGPRYVRNVQAITVAEGQAVINWEPVPSSDLAGYRVYRANGMTGNFEPLFDHLITGTQWTDDQAAEFAWYQVFAIDSSGNMSPPSDPTRVIPLKTNSQ